ncbi:hypothetical protein [Pseudobacter ginsenosidimutans]|nr:hypothetical protein [Pseudobacter ginsenosidimutans]QEC44439.1 hypothetical protein FSB84_23195 [Pseudobacter ginsenosidimutans]
MKFIKPFVLFSLFSFSLQLVFAQHLPLENWMQGLRIRQEVNLKHDYHVLFKDSTRLLVSSKIYMDTVLKKSYLLHTNKDARKSYENRIMKIYVDSTVSITRKSYDVGVKEGVANDSCWLFKLIDGKISVYSPFAEGSQSNSFMYKGLSIDGGPIESWEPEKILPLVKNVYRAYVRYSNKHYDECIKNYNRTYDKKNVRKSF